MTHDAVTDISVNYTTVWVKELDPKYSGVYIDSITSDYIALSQKFYQLHLVVVGNRGHRF
jgi:uncharacterized lipoprotein YehR (DUF1307 family)